MHKSMAKKGIHGEKGVRCRKWHTDKKRVHMKMEYITKKGTLRKGENCTKRVYGKKGYFQKEVHCYKGGIRGAKRMHKPMVKKGTLQKGVHGQKGVTAKRGTLDIQPSSHAIYVILLNQGIC